MFGRSIIVPLTVSALLVGCATAAEDETQEITDNLIQAPTTSPAAYSRTFATTGGGCESGYACAGVPYANGWYTFKFYYYGTYSLSNWFGSGVVLNSQTDGAAMRLLDGSGSQRQCISGNGLAFVDWGPIWSIKLTADNC